MFGGKTNILYDLQVEFRPRACLLHGEQLAFFDEAEIRHVLLFFIKTFIFWLSLLLTSLTHADCIKFM